MTPEELFKLKTRAYDECILRGADEQEMAVRAASVKAASDRVTKSRLDALKGWADRKRGEVEKMKDSLPRTGEGDAIADRLDTVLDAIDSSLADFEDILKEVE